MGREGSSILVVLATYNERESLPSLVSAILRGLPTADALVIDDDSPDGTGIWCDEFAKVDPRFRVVHRASKLGLGSATVKGFEAAISGGYDVVVTLDADWSHDPAVLPNLVAATAEAELVIGSRYCSGGQIEGWPWTRRLVSRTMNTVSHRWLRLPARDTSGSLRAYRVEHLRHVGLDQIEATGYAYLEEMVWLVARTGGRIRELPITFRERRAGHSKIGLHELAGKLRMLWRLTWRPVPGR